MRSPDRKLINLLRIFTVIICGAFSFPAIASTNLSVWVYPGASGRLISQPTATGDRILDYSGIGYGGGTIPLPSTNVVPVKIVVQPVAGDNVANIQAAINYVSGLPLDTNGFRGAVYLSNGVYNVGSQIKISTSGVVLRGAGSFTNGSGTMLYATATNAQSVLIEVSGSGSASTISGTTHNITNNYVPVGARSFWVNSASGLSVGQNVYIERFATSNWIHDLGMDLLGPPPDVPWTPGGYNMNMERTITHIEGNHIFVDAPITCSIDAVRYTNGTIRAYTWNGRITNCGVEHIFAQSWYGGNVTNENHQQSFIEFDRVVNGWVRDVADQYFVLYCVSINDNNKFCTVQDSQSLDPISIITGGRRYAFNINSSEYCIVKNCYTRQDRHQFVSESVTIGPDAFVDGLSDSAHGEAGPHQRWSTGVLWDNITVHGNNNDIQNAGNYGTGHGWEGGNCVIWNNAANGFIVQNPPLAQNWLIGSVGPIQTGSAWNIGNTNMPHAPGNYDSSGSGAQNVFPDSVYFNQLQDRLMVPNTQSRDCWLGGFGLFTNNPPGGVNVALNSAWSNAVKTVSGGQPLDNFDVVTNNHWVPFTFNFTLGVNERVVAATLALSMKVTNSAFGDMIYLGNTTNSFTFSSLNWTPIGSGTNITVRGLDLVNQLNLLTNGQLNVAVQGDIGIDWAMLELQVAPNAAVTTSTFTPIADATVRGGTSAGINYGTATTLTVRQDASANNQQQSFLKWNLSSVSGKIYQARVVLTPVSVGADNVEQGVMVTASNNWTENGVTWNNRSSGVERFATWIPSTGGTVSFDVTPQVLDAMQNDKQLSLELFSIGTNSVDYASRENANPANWPQLVISQPGIGPSISTIANQNILPNASAGPIAFTISGDTNSIVLSGDSSNPDLIPDSNIVFGGSGTNRTVTLTPLASQTGVATITISANDSGGLSASTSFTLTVSTHSPTTLVWNGPGSGANNWSTTNNWLPTYAPEYADNVKFFDAGGNGLSVSNINNFIASDTTIASLQFGNTNGNHTTLICDGSTLTISGSRGLTAGTETDNGNIQTDFATVTGSGGTLNMDNSSANLIVRQAASAGSGSQRATLDLSGLGNFNATVNQISVGAVGSIIRATGTLYLARTNNIAASGSPGILVGDNNSNGGGQNYIYLGSSNFVFADFITIARQKATATLAFNPAFPNSYAYFRGADGSSRIANWNIADHSLQNNSSSSSTGTCDFSGGTVDALVDALVVGKSQKTTGQNSRGTLTLASGIFDVNTLQVGFQAQSGAASGGIGQVNVAGSNAVLNVNTVLELGHTSGGIGTTNTFGALNIVGGTAFVNSIMAGAGSGTNSISMNSATLVLSNAAGSLASPIATMALTNSALQFSIVAGVTNCVATTLTTGGDSNVVNIASLPGGAAQYPLIAYSGTIGGAGNNFILAALPSGAQGYLSNNTASASVDLVVTNYVIPDSFLTWDGDFSSDWDAETANWKNNIAGDLNYIDGNDVVFNDSAAGATNVNITDTFAPDSVTVSNNLKNFAFLGDGNLTGTMALTKSGSGSLTIANTGSNDFTGNMTIAGGDLIVGDGTVNGNLPSVGNISDNGTLVFNRSNNVIVPNTVSGSGSISQIGGGILNLTAANSFSGGVLITNGTVLPGNSAALGGTSNPAVITNSGTLDVNGLALSGEPIVASGFGVNSNGAVVNSGSPQTSALRNVTLAGDAAFGGTSRWDIRNTGGTASLTTGGHAYKITKVGTNQVSLVGVSSIDSALGDIDIQQGTFAVQTSTAQVGDASKTITIHSNATLNFYQLSTPLNKNIVVQDGGIIFNERGPSYIGGGSTITLQGNAYFDATNNGAPATLNCSNVITGSGNLILVGGGTLTLGGTNTYTGSTLVTTGTLAFASSGSISNSALINVASDATIDVSSRNNLMLSLNTGQTLTGGGTINGSLTVNSNSVISPGNANIGVLTVSTSANLKGTAAMKFNKTAHTNDVILVSGSFNYFGGCILNVTNLSGTLTTTDSFRLFNASAYGTSPANALPRIIPAIPALNLAWNTNTLAIDGTLRITNAPTASPRFATAIANGNKLILTVTNGPAGYPFTVLSSTNVALPLANWTAMATNTFDVEGNFSITNAADSIAPQQFYLLQMQ